MAAKSPLTKCGMRRKLKTEYTASEGGENFGSSLTLHTTMGNIGKDWKFITSDTVGVFWVSDVFFNMFYCPQKQRQSKWHFAKVRNNPTELSNNTIF